ncbi:MAG: hypothetical protein NC823_02525, partial [Candidatus Omnitrophica bacterium]|nr:hypothetical protein [Candidatus Omnitrophota bacterium]
MINSSLYLDQKARKISLFLSCLLHTLAAGWVLIAARNFQKPVVTVPVYVVHLTQLPPILEPHLPQPVPQPVKAPEIPKKISVPKPTPTFSAEAYRKKLQEKLSEYQPLSSRTETPSPASDTFSPEAYRQRLEERLATARPERTIAKNPSTLPEIPRLTSQELPEVKLPSFSQEKQEIPDWYRTILKKKLEENWRILKPFSLKEETALV